MVSPVMRRGSSWRTQAPACLGNVTAEPAACWLVMGGAASGGGSDDGACPPARPGQTAMAEIVVMRIKRRTAFQWRTLLLAARRVNSLDVTARGCESGRGVHRQRRH